MLRRPGSPSVPTRPVVVFGSVNLDHVVRAERLARPGETVLGGSYTAVPGGKGLNQAVTAARQGAPVSMVCCVGDDQAGQVLLDVLGREGVGTACARVVPGAPTGAALVTVAPDGANAIVVAPGANAQLGVREVGAAWEHLPPGAVVLAQMEIPLASVAAALSIGKARGATTVLNPAPADPALGPELLAAVDVLVPNEGEAAALTGAATAKGAAEMLLAQGCQAVVVTLGERGALVAERGRAPVVIPAFEVEARDTTAAGDAFCGALAAALAEGADLCAAALRGSASGALAATVAGALPSLPGRPAVDALLAR